MQIAPGVDSSEWNALRLDDPSSPDWEKAITTLRSRIQGRFINPVDYLINAEEQKPAHERRFGFAVMAIDCLLVATLGAFIEGLEDTHGKSKATFIGFLTTRPLFKNDFSNLAERFYNDFRCGILHQAEVGGASKVWSVGPMIYDHAGKLTVNRTKFHEHLKAEFEAYFDGIARRQ